MDILKYAFSLEDDEIAREPEPEIKAAQPDNVANVPGDAQATIVMKGPLSVIYARALDVTYAKNNPVSGTTEIEGEAVGVESQAMDAVYAAAMAKRRSSAEQERSDELGESGDPEQDEFSVYNFGTAMAAPEEKLEVTKLFDQLGRTPGVPHEFIFVTSAMKATDDGSTGGTGTTMVEFGMNRREPEEVAIESISVVVKVRKR